MKIFVTASQPRRCRAGLVFTNKGRVIDTDTLDEERQTMLKNDPVLHIREATAEDEEGSPPSHSDEERDELIVDAVKKLDPADFDGSGKPRLPALREALDQPEIELDVKLRDAVFKVMVEGGFKVPTAD